MIDLFIDDPRQKSLFSCYQSNYSTRTQAAVPDLWMHENPQHLNETAFNRLKNST